MCVLGSVLCGLVMAGSASGASGPGPVGSQSPSLRTIPAALTSCPNPDAKKDGATPATGGLDPDQLAAAYDLSSLRNAGYSGQGRRVALLEVGDSLDTTRDPTSFPSFANCYLASTDVAAAPTQETVPEGIPLPPAGGESTFDAEVVGAIAPQAHIYVFESAHGTTIPGALPGLLTAALNPRNTHGKEVNAISMSLAYCEAGWTTSEVRRLQAVLRRAASLGVSVFAAAGDAGSVASYTYYPHGSSSPGVPVCIEAPGAAADTQLPSTSLGVNLPASSPLVTAVGGTELQINGTVPQAGAPAGGTITDEPVWDQPFTPTSTLPAPFTWAGGGGQSNLFTVSQAPWQREVGQSGQEKKPDISALAGSPQYLYGGIGTSGASPLMAGSITVLDDYLAAQHAKPIGPLNPTLYRIADSMFYHQVFNDVVHGTNDTVGLGCCTAGAGYDEASGLGSLNIAALGATLLAHPRLEVPWTTLELAAYPANSTGIPEIVRATTNNVVTRTPYHISIYVDGKLVATCKTSVCFASLAPTPSSRATTYEVTADVGPAGAKPFGNQALVSAKRKVSVHYTRPCTPPHCS